MMTLGPLNFCTDTLRALPTAHLHPCPHSKHSRVNSLHACFVCGCTKGALLCFSKSASSRVVKTNESLNTAVELGKWRPLNAVALEVACAVAALSSAPLAPPDPISVPLREAGATARMEGWAVVVGLVLGPVGRVVLVRRVEVVEGTGRVMLLGRRLDDAV